MGFAEVYLKRRGLKIKRRGKTFALVTEPTIIPLSEDKREKTYFAPFLDSYFRNEMGKIVFNGAKYTPKEFETILKMGETNVSLDMIHKAKIFLKTFSLEDIIRVFRF